MNKKRGYPHLPKKRERKKLTVAFTEEFARIFHSQTSNCSVCKHAYSHHTEWYIWKVSSTHPSSGDLLLVPGPGSLLPTAWRMVQKRPHCLVTQKATSTITTSTRSSTTMMPTIPPVPMAGPPNSHSKIRLSHVFSSRNICCMKDNSMVVLGKWILALW